MDAPLDLSGNVKIRPGLDGDRAFVTSSWLKSYRVGSESASAVPGPVYFREQQAVIDKILARGALVVACAPDRPEQIFGWAAGERTRDFGVLHYLYEKKLFRGLGFEQLLLDALAISGGFYTHRTPPLEAIARSRGLILNPYLAGVLP